ncbi:MAG: putative quinol monooxygenase [Gemmobacter sp.]
MIRVTGTLHCPDAAARDALEAHLAEHVRLSRAEPGCLHFEIVPTSDPLVLAVDEGYRDADAFAAHKARAAGAHGVVRVECARGRIGMGRGDGRGAPRARGPR